MSTPPPQKKRRVSKKKKVKKDQEEEKTTLPEFNQPPTPEELKLWRAWARFPLLPLGSLQEMHDALSVDMIGFTDDERKDGLYAVENFIHCAELCRIWLRSTMGLIGWKENLTSYDPICVSHNTPELLSATVNCAKLMCRQMMQLVRAVGESSESLPAFYK